jgi:hypothetical protein
LNIHIIKTKKEEEKTFLSFITLKNMYFVHKNSIYKKLVDSLGYTKLHISSSVVQRGRKTLFKLLPVFVARVYIHIAS